MRRWPLPETLLVLALAGGAAYLWTRMRPESQESRLPVLAVQRGDLALKVTVSGTLAPRHKALITPPYDGYIQKLYVKVGDKVKENAPIVAITQTVGRAVGEIFPLRAPLGGTVVQVWRSEGERVTVAPGASGDATIVRIDDLSKLFVEASVAEVDVDKLAAGQPTLIRALALPGRTFQGQILEIMQAAKEQDRWERSRVEFPIRVEVLDPDERLKPGMSAVLDILVQEARNVLVLPQEFVEREGPQAFVTLENGEKRPVEVGLQNEEAFEIRSGLKEGDRVRQVDFLAIAATPGAPPPAEQ